jgi:hypothetical protein
MKRHTHTNEEDENISKVGASKRTKTADVENNKRTIINEQEETKKKSCRSKNQMLNELDLERMFRNIQIKADKKVITSITTNSDYIQANRELKDTNTRRIERRDAFSSINMY